MNSVPDEPKPGGTGMKQMENMTDMKNRNA